jgi:release factor glutamine methyltransferase
MDLKHKLINKIYKSILEHYLKKDRTYNKFGLKINVPSGVFHPAFFGTTLFMANFINKLEIKNKTLLEVGCGAGLLSILAAKSGAVVTALDINPKAVEATKTNNIQNSTNITVIETNLFQNISQTFDFIIVNPPFFKKNPSHQWEYAWLAGQNLEYFHSFFQQLKTVTHPKSNTYMVLAENCPLQEIFSIAQQNHYIFIEVISQKLFYEKQIIYQIKPLEKQ